MRIEAQENVSMLQGSLLRRLRAIYDNDDLSSVRSVRSGIESQQTVLDYIDVTDEADEEVVTVL